MFISRRGQIPRRRDPRPEQSRLGPRGPGEGAGARRRQLPERVQHGQGVVEGAPRQGAKEANERMNWILNCPVALGNFSKFARKLCKYPSFFVRDDASKNSENWEGMEILQIEKTRHLKKCCKIEHVLTQSVLGQILPERWQILENEKFWEAWAMERTCQA